LVSFEWPKERIKINIFTPIHLALRVTLPRFAFPRSSPFTRVGVRTANRKYFLPILFTRA
jgi:hypothetical protein